MRFRHVLDIQALSYPAQAMETATRPYKNAHATMAGLASHVTYQTAQAPQTAMIEDTAMQHLTHQDVQTVQGHGWDQSAMTPVCMDRSLLKTPSTVSVNQAGQVWVVTLSAQEMETL